MAIYILKAQPLFVFQKSVTSIVILQSANAFEEDIRKSLDAGMNAHLAKPVEPDAMYAALARQLMERAEEGSTK